ncbi:MAG: glycine reductase [Tissierellia bacterium]|nr:glycine reductase [Tissierellia bacterium]
MLIITNNPRVKEVYSSKTQLYEKEEYVDILIRVRDLVHAGYIILTHPLYGSVKPYETPFRTVVLQEGSKLDMNSLALIEEAIATATKFKRDANSKQWTSSVIEDFQVIDLDLIGTAIERI